MQLKKVPLPCLALPSLLACKFFLPLSEPHPSMATALLLLLLTVPMLGVSGVILMFLPVALPKVSDCSFLVMLLVTSICLWCLRRCIRLLLIMKLSDKVLIFL